jgi:hypothetical protein
MMEYSTRGELAGVEERDVRGRHTRDRNAFSPGILSNGRIVWWTSIITTRVD